MRDHGRSSSPKSTVAVFRRSVISVGSIRVDGYPVVGCCELLLDRHFGTGSDLQGR